MQREPNAPGWAALWREGYALYVLLTCFGIWLHAADALMVATMIPSIVADIGGAQWIAWTVALYEIGSIVAGAASALLAIRFGLRRAMTTAALLYGAGCVVSALAPDMPTMLAGRLAQGLGGGAMVALSLMAVARLFPARLMPRAMAAVSLVWGISAFSGPLVGGVFAQIGMWRGGFWFFAIQAGLLAAWLVVALGGLDRGQPSTAPAGFPARRLALLCGGVIAVAAAGIGVGLLRSGLLIGAAIVLFWLFLRADARAGADRLLPRSPLSLRNRPGAALLMILTMSAATIPIGVYGPVLMTILHGVPAIVAGYVLAGESIGWSVMAVLLSGSPERHDKRLILLGMTLTALAVPALYLAIANGPVWAIAVAAIVQGAGFGIAWTFVLRRLSALSAGTETDRLSAAMPTVQRLGYALGAAVTGIAANAAGFSVHAGGSQAQITAFWVFAAIGPAAILGIAAAWRFTRS